MPTEKLEQLLKQWNGGALRGALARLAREIDVSRAAISLLVNDKMELSSKMEEGIAKALNIPRWEVRELFPFLNKQPTPRPEPEDVKLTVKEIVKEPVNKSNNSVDNLYPVPIIGVFGKNVGQLDMGATPVGYLAFTMRAGQAFAIRVAGDGLAPFTYDGECLLFRHETFITPGALMLLRIGTRYVLGTTVDVDGKTEVLPLNATKAATEKDLLPVGIYFGVFRP